VVDDDPEIRALLSRTLGEGGYQVIEAADGSTTLASMSERAPDLILLDVMLGSEDGLDVLATIRRSSDVPVIMLTGKGLELDRVLGLKLGADDYVVKPFFPAELAARISTVLRRARPRETSAGHMQFGDLAVDSSTREVTLGADPIEMTAKEFDLLAFMARSPRQVFTRAQLLEQVWDSSSAWQGEGTVTEHVRRIRRKIESDPDNPRWLRTVRGVGYRFEP
jgi:DNA-binding response OmpR family regulator